MPPKILNPIAQKISDLVNSGKTTYEKICVVTDIKYPTLRNIFMRNKVSKITMKLMRLSEVITDNDERIYNEWIAARRKRK